MLYWKISLLYCPSLTIYLSPLKKLIEVNCFYGKQIPDGELYDDTKYWNGNDKFEKVVVMIYTAASLG